MIYPLIIDVVLLSALCDFMLQSLQASNPAWYRNLPGGVMAALTKRILEVRDENDKGRVPRLRP